MRLDFIDVLLNNLPETIVNIDKASLEKYSHDETENLRFLPQVVIKPRNTNEVSKVMKICNSYNVRANSCFILS